MSMKKVSLEVFRAIAEDSRVKKSAQDAAYRVMVLGHPITAAAEWLSNRDGETRKPSYVHRIVSQLRAYLPDDGSEYVSMKQSFMRWFEQRVVRVGRIESGSGRKMPPKVSAMRLRADYSRWAFYQRPKAPAIDAARFGSWLQEVGTGVW